MQNIAYAVYNVIQLAIWYMRKMKWVGDDGYSGISSQTKNTNVWKQQ